MADLPNPQRRRHPTNPSLLLPKVFIAYPHKPTPYTQLGPPPAGASPEQIAEAVFRHGKAEEEEIRKHKEKVKAFADFLQKNCVAVAYDRLLEDAGSDNIVRWCQSQIETSDYLILIITPSFKPFLGKNGCPPDKEHVFHSDFLYNLIHGSCPEHTEIVPVFLQCPKDLNHLPVALHTSTIYEVWGAYTQPFEPDLEALYCRLTKQNRYQPPEPLKAPIVIEPRRGPFGRRRPAANSAENEPLLASLSQNHTSLSSRAILKLSETSSFAKHWREIARHLDLSEAEIEQCEGRGGSDQEEICLQVLQCCSNKHGSLTVASLTKAIVKGRLHSSLQILHSVVSTC